MGFARYDTPLREIRVTHLFVADEAPDTSSWWISQVSLCGEEVRGPSTPAGDPDLTTTYRCCSDCVAEAACLASDDGSGVEAICEVDGPFVHVTIREIKPDLVARERWESTR